MQGDEHAAMPGESAVSILENTTRSLRPEVAYDVVDRSMENGSVWRRRKASLSGNENGNENNGSTNEAVWQNNENGNEAEHGESTPSARKSIRKDDLAILDVQEIIGHSPAISGSGENDANDRGRKRKLVLHFDVRNTILVSDSATCDDVEQALNSFLSGVTWGREEPDVGWVWYGDEPSLAPPCDGAVTYYKSRERALVRSPADRVLLRRATGDFTRQPIGSRFRSYFDRHLKLLEWNAVTPNGFRNRNETNGNHINPDGVAEPMTGNGFDATLVNETGNGSKPEVDRLLTIVAKDGRLYHYLLPSFVKLLYDLHAEGRRFAIVLRTYGVDAPKVLESVEHILAGNHPMFPDRIPISVRRTPGRIHRQDAGRVVAKFPPRTHATGSTEQPEVGTSDADIYRWLSDVDGVSGFVDDFCWWQEHDYSHAAGKPFWIDPRDPDVQHIFFDDNLRVADPDGIVDVRLFDDDDISGSGSRRSARSLTLADIGPLENVCLVQADLLACTDNVDYFADRVRVCERNYDAWLANRMETRDGLGGVKPDDANSRSPRRLDLR